MWDIEWIMKRSLVYIYIAVHLSSGLIWYLQLRCALGLLPASKAGFFSCLSQKSYVGASPRIRQIIFKVQVTSAHSYLLLEYPEKSTNVYFCIFFNANLIIGFQSSDRKKIRKLFLSPPVHFAQWAHMRRFLSVCPSVCPSGRTWPKFRLDNNSYLRKYCS